MADLRAVPDPDLAKEIKAAAECLLEAASLARSLHKHPAYRHLLQAVEACREAARTVEKHDPEGEAA